MTEEFDTFFEDFQLCRKSIGFVSDHMGENDGAMAILMRVEREMESLENRFRVLAVQ